MTVPFTRAVLVAAAFLPSMSGAQQAPAPITSAVRVLAGFAFTSGGDTLATAHYEGGKTSAVKAGGSANLYGGFEYLFKDLPVGLQATLGGHVDSSAASSGNIVFRRYPLEALAMYRANDILRLGAGLRHAFSPSLAGTGAAANIGTTKFDASLSPIFKAEYTFNARYGVELRYVDERYKPKAGGNAIDGSHIGAGFNACF
jgi:hypothetical protein